MNQERINYVELATAASTNSELASMEAADWTVVYTHCQTAGRGQRGNSWEAEPGANVTLSALLRPRELAARDQFMISEAVALAVADTVRHFGELGDRVAVKWPNDIYVDDRKIAGILIEHSITGSLISRTIAGIGLNVNQTEFRSDAPNPVSLSQLTGLRYDVEEVMRYLCEKLYELVEYAENPAKRAGLHRQYRRELWRGEGYYPYTDAAAGERFMARIADVASDGMLTLEDSDGMLRRYAFKEVAAEL